MSVPDHIGSIEKSDAAEVRVSTSTWNNRRVVDIRVWFIPNGGNELVPSKKGITVDVSKVAELINILERIGK